MVQHLGPGLLEDKQYIIKTQKGIFITCYIFLCILKEFQSKVSQVHLRLHLEESNPELVCTVLNMLTDLPFVDLVHF